MAFSKIAGLEVTPRSESSRTSRWSSPHSIRPRRIWSSQTLVPASVSAARRSLTPALTSIASPFLGARAHPLDHGLAALGDLLGRETKVLVQILLGAGGSEAAHADRLAVVGHPRSPTKGRGGLDADPGAYARGQDLVAVVLVLLREGVEAGCRDHTSGHPVRLQQVGGVRADVQLRPRADQDQVRLVLLVR